MSRLVIMAVIIAFGLCAFVPVSAVFAQPPNGNPAAESDAFDPSAIVPASQFLVRTFEHEGKLIDEVIVPGRPPKDYRAPVAHVPATNAPLGIVVLSEVPAFDWSYGCSATSAAMIMGYYDRHGFPDMYSGPTNGGVCPLNNSVWGHTTYPSITVGECPLSATHQGVDGRAIKGHVDDYWIDYGSSGLDPWITGGWTQHMYRDCTGDYMGTNQSSLSNIDGGTTFYYFPDGSPLCDYNPGSGKQDGCHGMRLFAQSRGYTVLSNCSQYIYGYNDNTQGFTFAQYCAEIDAGRPVLIHLAGHTMVGYGYNTTGNIVYIHDTWDYNDHTMTWGGYYSGLQHYAVTTFQLAPATPGIVTDTSSVTVTEGNTAAFGVKLSMPPADSVTVSVSRVSGDTDINVHSGASLTFDTTNYDTYQTVTLSAAQDTDIIDGTATIRCSAPGMTNRDLTATESDDDRAILTDTTSLVIPEGNQGTLYVKLKGQPSSSVTVYVNRISGDNDIYISSGSNLVFTTSNWSSYQPVVINAAHDADGIEDSAVIRCSLTNWTSAEVNVTAPDDEAKTIAQIKQLPDGELAASKPAVVTGVFGDSFYVESEDRSSGIRVHKAGHGHSIGAKVAVSGTMMTGEDGERFVEASVTSQSGLGTIRPLGLINRAAGGDDWMYDPSTGAGQRRTINGVGLNNTGLLVRSFGKVVQQQSAPPEIRFWNFDTDPGWTFQGQWAWGTPTGGGSSNRDPISGYTGTNVVGYNLSGNYENNIASPYYATTPAVNCSGYQSVKLSFRRWLAVESSSFDHANIQVSNNGTNWTDVWNHVGDTLSESSWSLQEYDISAVADNQPTVYIRWGMGSTDSSVTYPGWNIDDVTITGSGGGSSIIIRDGSGSDVKVIIPSGITVPDLDSFVSVTGISSCEKIGEDLYPVIKVRTPADIN